MYKVILTEDRAKLPYEYYIKVYKDKRFEWLVMYKVKEEAIAFYDGIKTENDCCPEKILMEKNIEIESR